MRKPTRRGRTPATEPPGKGFPGGRAMERVRQFERARGLGPPLMAEAPALPPGAEPAAKRSARKAAATPKKPGQKGKKPGRKAKRAAGRGATSPKSRARRRG